MGIINGVQDFPLNFVSGKGRLVVANSGNMNSNSAESISHDK